MHVRGQRPHRAGAQQGLHPDRPVVQDDVPLCEPRCAEDLALVLRQSGPAVAPGDEGSQAGLLLARPVSRPQPRELLGQRVSEVAGPLAVEVEVSALQPLRPLGARPEVRKVVPEVRRESVLQRGRGVETVGIRQQQVALDGDLPWRAQHVGIAAQRHRRNRVGLRHRRIPHVGVVPQRATGRELGGRKPGEHPGRRQVTGLDDLVHLMLAELRVRLDPVDDHDMTGAEPNLRDPLGEGRPGRSSWNFRDLRRTRPDLAREAGPRGGVVPRRPQRLLGADRWDRPTHQQHSSLAQVEEHALQVVHAMVLEQGVVYDGVVTPAGRQPRVHRLAVLRGRVQDDHACSREGLPDQGGPGQRTVTDEHGHPGGSRAGAQRVVEVRQQVGETRYVPILVCRDRGERRPRPPARSMSGVGGWCAPCHRDDPLETSDEPDDPSGPTRVTLVLVDRHAPLR